LIDSFGGEMSWAIFIPDDEARRITEADEARRRHTTIGISDDTYRAPGRKTRRASISDHEEGPRRKRRRRATTVDKARYTRFYRVCTMYMLYCTVYAF
jgi:hypothetical protein